MLTAPIRDSEQSNKIYRRKLLAATNIIWKELRPDLVSRDELREARLDFAAAELKIPPIGSFSELTTAQLVRVLTAMQREQTQPRLSGCNTAPPDPASQAADVIHLASKEQRWAIQRIFSYLGWSETGCAAFLKNKYRRENPALLTGKQANGAIRVLLNVAAARDLKMQHGETTRISQPMIRAYLPRLKQAIGFGSPYGK